MFLTAVGESRQITFWMKFLMWYLDDMPLPSRKEEYAILAVPGLAGHLREKAKVELIGTNVTNKEVIAE